MSVSRAVDALFSADVPPIDDYRGGFGNSSMAEPYNEAWLESPDYADELAYARRLDEEDTTFLPPSNFMDISTAINDGDELLSDTIPPLPYEEELALEEEEEESAVPLTRASSRTSRRTLRQREADAAAVYAAGAAARGRELLQAEKLVKRKGMTAKQKRIHAEKSKIRQQELYAYRRENETEEERMKRLKKRREAYMRKTATLTDAQKANRAAKAGARYNALVERRKEAGEPLRRKR
jgi:hypothetical protein